MSKIIDNALTVLLTGVGCPGIRGTLYALRNNCCGINVKTVGVDINLESVGRFFVDEFYSVPPPESKVYLERLLEICLKRSVQLIIPQTTREVEVLSRHKKYFTNEGIKVMVSSKSAIKLANNKLQVMKTFEKLNLPFPEYRIIGSEKELIEGAKYLDYPQNPVVIKPLGSSGMRGVRILKENAWDIKRFLQEKPNGLEISLEDLICILRRGGEWPQLLLTEYLSNSEYTVDVYMGKEKPVIIPRIRKAIRSGISFETSIDYRQDIIQYTLKASKHIGLRYAFGFQFKLDSNGIPKVIECNPRIQGTMVASIFSGVNIIWMAVQDAMGMQISKAPDNLAIASFHRFWGGIGESKKTVNEI